jgi:hypothetical protein
MAFGTFLTIFLFCLGSALAMVLADNAWALYHSWLLPVLLWCAGLSGLCTVLSARWFKSIYQRITPEGAARKTVHTESSGDGSPNITAMHGSTVTVNQAPQFGWGGASAPMSVQSPTLPDVQGEITNLSLSEIRNGGGSMLSFSGSLFNNSPAEVNMSRFVVTLTDADGEEHTSDAAVFEMLTMNRSKGMYGGAVLPTPLAEAVLKHRINHTFHGTAIFERLPLDKADTKSLSAVFVDGTKRPHPISKRGELRLQAAAD